MPRAQVCEDGGSRDGQGQAAHGVNAPSHTYTPHIPHTPCTPHTLISHTHTRNSCHTRHTQTPHTLHSHTTPHTHSHDSLPVIHTTHTHTTLTPHTHIRHSHHTHHTPYVTHTTLTRTTHTHALHTTCTAHTLTPHTHTLTQPTIPQRRCGWREASPPSCPCGGGGPRGGALGLESEVGPPHGAKPL